MEAALALRSVERSVEEVLLPSVNELGERHGFDSAPWAFAARWASDWLQRAQRLAPPPMRPAAILAGDATRDDLDPDALALRALQLFAVRSGARVLALPVSGVSGLGDVLTRIRPAGRRDLGQPRVGRRGGPLGLPRPLRRRPAAHDAVPPRRPLRRRGRTTAPCPSGRARARRIATCWTSSTAGRAGSRRSASMTWTRRTYAVR